MKISKLFTIDYECADYLRKSENASALVNRLILQEMDLTDLNSMSMEQKARELEALKLEKKMKKEAQLIRKGLNDK